MREKRKSSKSEKTFVYVLATIITISSIIFFEIIGYPLVSTASGTLNEVAPPLYMVPVFFLLGILLGELLWILYVKSSNIQFIILFVEMSLISLFSLLRYLFKIPVSGHTLILSFYLLHQLINNNTSYPLRIFIGFIILLITLIYKIFLWQDPITFLFGAIVGTLIWLLGHLFRRKFE